MSPITRRQLLVGTAATAATAAATRASAQPTSRRVAPSRKLPDPATSGVDDIVVVVMENRSFDHYLGWLPGAVGKQAGLRYADNNGVLHPTHHLTERQGCGFNDPDHSYAGGRIEFNGGKCDGFRKGSNDDFAIGYYTKDDLPFYSKLVGAATVFDHWFPSIMSQTYPNRFYTHAGRTDRNDNSMTTSTLPTLWDQMSAAGISANYYFNDLPFLGLWGDKYVPISRPYETFLAQAASGTLPQFSYVDPFFVGEDQGGSNDDHPHADIHRGQAFVSQIVNAVVNGPQWNTTALVITYDEWGGFFDHVAPPRLPDDPPAGGFDRTQMGFRVPAFVVSPFAKRGGIDHAVYNHASILSFVQWRFGLKPISPKNAASRNLAYALDFKHRNASVPSLPTVTDPGPHICGSPDVGMAAEGESFWWDLKRRVEADPAWRNLL